MSRLVITTASRIYTVSPDDPMPREGQFRAFAAGQALDKISQRPLLSTVEIAVHEPGFTAMVKDQNWFVIAGILRQQLPLLATQPSPIHFTLSAAGYQPLAVIAIVPQTPAGLFPPLVIVPPAQTGMLSTP